MKGAPFTSVQQLLFTIIFILYTINNYYNNTNGACMNISDSLQFAYDKFIADFGDETDKISAIVHDYLKLAKEPGLRFEEKNKINETALKFFEVNIKDIKERQDVDNCLEVMSHTSDQDEIKKRISRILGNCFSNYRAVTLKVLNEEIVLSPLEKKRLIDGSSYFKMIFLANFQEKELSEIRIEEISREQLTTIVKFICSNNQTLTDEIKEDILCYLQLADRFDIPSLKRQIALELVGLIKDFTVSKNDCDTALLLLKNDVICRGFSIEFPVVQDELSNYFNNYLARLDSTDQISTFLHEMGEEDCAKINLLDLDLFRLDITHCLKFDEIKVLLVNSLTNLKTITGAVDSSLIPHLASQKKLETLTYEISGSSDNEMQDLAQHTNLQSLVLYDNCREGFKGAGLKHIGSLLNLRELTLDGFTTLIDTDVQHLAPLINLQKLTFINCYNLTDAALQYIGGLVNLRDLGFKKTEYNNDDPENFTGSGLKYLSSLKNLKNLDLGLSRSLSDDNLIHLTLIENLQSLDLDFCYSITNIGLIYLGWLVNLQKLSLNDCPSITAEGLPYLGQLVNVQEWGLRIDHESFEEGERFDKAVVLLKQLQEDNRQRLAQFKNRKHL